MGRLTRPFPSTGGGWGSSLGCSPSLKLSSGVSSSESRSLGRKWSLSRPFSNVGAILTLGHFVSFSKFLVGVVHWPSEWWSLGEFLIKEQKNANQNE